MYYTLDKMTKDYIIEVGDVVKLEVGGMDDFGKGKVVQMEYLTEKQAEKIKEIMDYDFAFDGLVLVNGIEENRSTSKNPYKNNYKKYVDSMAKEGFYEKIVSFEEFIKINEAKRDERLLSRGN